ncbi:MAG: hypothetical protein OQK50_04090 [Deltaproteobacteria bacterium]|nr:hypothetical protein [Deltaproteobacteria bacterium]MCW9049494.1 hypothetical protein [Deltaproteobacteria bacterium]
MRVLICLLAVTMMILVTSQAATYSCRDSQGQLHITDNLQALPEDCRGSARIYKPETPDNLNFVPQKAAPKGSGAEFQEDVRNAEREIQQKQLRIESYLQRAEQLSADYLQAEKEKRQATRRWSYGSRDIIRQADERIARARLGKKQLLQELSGQKIAKDDEKKILLWLNEIAE